MALYACCTKSSAPTSCNVVVGMGMMVRPTEAQTIDYIITLIPSGRVVACSRSKAAMTTATSAVYSARKALSIVKLVRNKPVFKYFFSFVILI